MVAAPSGEVGDGVGECVSDEVELVGTEAGGVQVVEGVKVDMGHGFLWILVLHMACRVTLSA